jgi:hypothetical protein
LRSKNLQLKNGTGLQFPEFHEVKLRKTKPRSGLVRARDRSGIFALEGQKLERIARSCRKAAGCAQIHRLNRVGILVFFLFRLYTFAA